MTTTDIARSLRCFVFGCLTEAPAFDERAHVVHDRAYYIECAEQQRERIILGR